MFNRNRCFWFFLYFMSDPWIMMHVFNLFIIITSRLLWVTHGRRSYCFDPNNWETNSGTLLYLTRCGLGEEKCQYSICPVRAKPAFHWDVFIRRNTRVINKLIFKRGQSFLFQFWWWIINTPQKSIAWVFWKTIVENCF